ncbi:hypothetical protein NUU61_010116 [Penicillium alfredii]|uniref:PH domain-containing protein n=1 Tax=Penicillium alfredii TaxID=1506179 RepID=A0A9W9EHC8_9EURO|nr:uncharacterized protein NUU61_010116 [Penicillium alfredii]KAJ5081852.1 hypothetical protein NUU61_010116 [Penicillium alfredii]
MTQDEQPSIGERRGHRLAPLQTNFSRPTAAQLAQSQQSRLQRPRPTDYPSTNGSENPVPLQSPVKRQSSKTSLRSLFGRDKSSRAPETTLMEIEEIQPPTQADDTMSTGLASPRTVASAATLTSPTSQQPRLTLKTARPKPELVSSQEQYGWKPPPLFQAYPQSYKHDCLLAPAVSADSILRLHETAGKASEDAPRGSLGRGEPDDARKKREQRQRKHLRTLSGTINKVEWSKKIYVLTTAGFILQYAGDGKHDRLPEKMLQLGPQSVAFASDAIPGKHWVLQISHNPTADASPAPEPPKPRFSRFGFHRSNARRLARSFLLVFDNPDAMISWLTAVRAEIEARGGPKFTAEKHSDDDAEPRLRVKSSVRQTVKKDPHRISSLFLQPQTLRPPEEDEDGQSVGGLTWQSRRSSYVSVNRRSMIGSRSGSVSTSRTEATAPNGTGPALMTKDMRTPSFTSTNPTSSPPMRNGSFTSEEPLPEQGYTRSPPSSAQPKRQSVYMSPNPQSPPTTAHSETAQPGHPLSNIPNTFVRSTSPPAPNFSVPSFSKKFVTRGGPITSPQVSPPSTSAGVARRADASIDPNLSTFSSPPQSPTYSVASSRHTESSEAPGARDGTGRRTLRMSNSEDVLAKTARSSHAPNFSRVPRATAPDTVSPPSSRPQSLVFRSELGLQMNIEPQSQPQTMAHPVDSTPRTRVSSLYTDKDASNMSRRKSMPGLSMGPPSAPPPTCPLPKIPSPTTAQAPAPAPWYSSSPSDRFYQYVQDQVRDRPKSGVVSGIPPPSSGKLTKNSSKAAARHSRILFGGE